MILRSMQWASFYNPNKWKFAPSGAQNELPTFAVYSFATLKLIRVSMEPAEILEYVRKKHIKKCILVKHVYEHNDLTKGHKRLEYTPSVLSKRLRFTDTTDTSRVPHWNRMQGTVTQEE